jgi:hypothetical protein
MFALPRERAELAARRLDVRIVWVPLLDIPLVFGDGLVIACEAAAQEAAAALERIGPKSDVGR